MPSIDQPFEIILQKARAIAIQNKNSYIGIEHIVKAIYSCEYNRLKEVLDIMNPGISISIINHIDSGIPKGNQEVKNPEYTNSVNTLIHTVENKEFIIQSILEFLIESKNQYFEYLLRISKIDRNYFTRILLNKDNLFAFDASDLRVNTPFLNESINRDLTLLAKQNKLDPVIGREKEIQDISKVILRYKYNNPLLIGKAGTGKTTIIEGFAQYLLSQECHDELKHYKIVELSITNLLENTGILGQLQTKMKMILEELKANPEIIVFIDEIHMMMGAGAVKDDSSNTIANILKPALSSGQIKLIGATTISEYRKYMENDTAIKDRFRVIQISEPDIKECSSILMKWQNTIFHKHYSIDVDEEIFHELPKLCKDFLPLSPLPRSAINLIDECLAKAKLQGKLKLELQDIKQQMAEISGMDLLDINTDPGEKIERLEKELREQLIGQSIAIDTMINYLYRAYDDLERNSKRPIAVCLLYGPSGVGKTYFCKLLAKHLFGNDQKFLRINMQDYITPHSISNLIGSSRGLIGSEDGGILTNHLKQNPYSIILLDEIEKSIPEIWQFFLALFDDNAHVTDPQTGENLSTQNIIFIMTSNIKESDRRTIGFDTQANIPEVTNVIKLQNENIIKQLKEAGFSDPFIGRIGSYVPFLSLTTDNLIEIAKLELNEFIRTLIKRGFNLHIEDSVYQLLASQAESHTMGARLLNRIIEQTIQIPISKMIVTKSIKPGFSITISSDNGIKINQN